MLSIMRRGRFDLIKLRSESYCIRNTQQVHPCMLQACHPWQAEFLHAVTLSTIRPQKSKLENN